MVAFREAISKRQIYFQIDSSDVDLIINDDILENGELSPCTRSEVNKLIASLKPKKAAGFDLITSKVLVELPHKTLDNLTSLFNACIHWKYFHSVWKVAAFVIIAKPGKSPSIVYSYRPISLLPINFYLNCCKKQQSFLTQRKLLTRCGMKA